jgi:hypothetical protein
MSRGNALAAIIVTALLISGCGTQPVSEPEPRVPRVHDWVVVTYVAETPGRELEAMKALLKTELAADQALRDAGAGLIDGNEVGQGEYDLYFVGRDREAMWQVLRPVFDDAPVAWRRVELRHGLDDKDPTVFRG